MKNRLADFITGNAEENGIVLKIGDNWCYGYVDDGGKIKTQTGNGKGPMIKSKERKLMVMYYLIYIGLVELFIATDILDSLESMTSIGPVFWVVNAFLLGFLALVLLGMNKSTRQFHAAEHKIIHAVANNTHGSVEDVQRESRLHERCGTSVLVSRFLFTATAFNVSYGLLSLLGAPWLAIAAIPLSIMFAVKRIGVKTNKFGLINKFTMLAQLFTTAKPQTLHIEVAVETLRGLLLFDIAESQKRLDKGALLEADLLR